MARRRTLGVVTYLLGVLLTLCCLFVGTQPQPVLEKSHGLTRSYYTGQRRPSTQTRRSKRDAVVMTDDCPKLCRCSTDLKHANCSNHNATLTSIEGFTQNFRANVETLDLSFNAFDATGNATFYGFAKLKALTLASVHLTTIAASAFDASSSLERLDLAQNRIADLEAQVFKFLINLRFLNLSQNELSSIPGDVFSSATNLSILDLSCNKITYFNPVAFENNIRLEHLNISNNLLTHLPSDLFRDMSALKTLNASFCKLRSFPIDTLLHLKALNTLDMSHNQMTHLSHDDVSMLMALTHLNCVILIGNALSCDCNLLPLTNKFRTEVSKLAVECTLPTAVVNRTDADSYQTDYNTQYDVRSHVESTSSPLQQEPYETDTSVIYTEMNLSHVAGALSCNYTNLTKPLTSIDSGQSYRDDSSEYTYRAELGEVEYDPRLGVYTAAVLFTMLMVVVLVVLGDKAKRVYYRHLRRKLRALERQAAAMKQSQLVGGGGNTPTCTSTTNVIGNTSSNDHTLRHSNTKTLYLPLSGGQTTRSFSRNRSAPTKLSSSSTASNLSCARTGGARRDAEMSWHDGAASSRLTRAVSFSLCPEEVRTCISQ